MFVTCALQISATAATIDSPGSETHAEQNLGPYHEYQQIAHCTQGLGPKLVRNCALVGMSSESRCRVPVRAAANAQRPFSGWRSCSAID